MLANGDDAANALERSHSLVSARVRGKKTKYMRVTSWPPMRGSLAWMGQSPLRACKSVWQTPLQSSSTRHSPGASSEGCLTGWLSMILSGSDVFSTMAAFWTLGMLKDMAAGLVVVVVDEEDEAVE